MAFRATLVSLLAAVAMATNARERGYYEEKFFNWLQTFPHLKPANAEHFVQWLNNFATNEDIINRHNAQANVTYTLGHNQFSHLSLDEWKQYIRLGLTKPVSEEPPVKIHQAEDFVAPTAYDWAAQGAVTGVKDQGNCGSCWSFSSTGALEGAYYIKSKQLISLSEQDLVDCDTTSNGGSDAGCNGGLMDNAFTWVKKNGGICTEAAYPYTSGSTGKSTTCNDKACAKQAAVPKSYTDVATTDAALVSAIAQQPVSVAIEADQSAFQLYKSGVFTGTCGTNLDHGVLAVGYGTDYYKVKNSWGSSWGESGFIRLTRNSSQKGGQCGILLGASYPNL